MNHDLDMPCAKIKIIKSNMEGEREFIITPEGLIWLKNLLLKIFLGVYKSDKNTTNRDIMIGRQHSTAEVIYELILDFNYFKTANHT